MADITKDQVKKVADLARLAISEKETEMFTEQLSSILKYAKKINELNTEDVEPTTHGIDLKNVLRKDESKQWITSEEALKNAPDKQDGHFRVPSILE